MKIALRVASVVLLSAVFLFAQGQDSRLWQDDLEYLVKRIEIMHPNPYAYFPREEFIKLKDALSERIPRLSEAEIVISLSELLARLEDGHTRMGFEYSDPSWLNRTFHLLPFILYSFDDGFYILAGMPEHKEWVGAKVLRIGNMPAEEAAGKFGALYSHDNRSGEKKNLWFTLGLAEMLKHIGAVEAVDRINLTLQTATNKGEEVSIATVPFTDMARHLGSWYPQAGSALSTMNETSANPLPLWRKHRQEAFWFEYVPEEKMMFLQINSLSFSWGNGPGSFGRQCEGFFKAFDQSAPEKLVIDIRANHGGNHVELPLLKGILARPAIDRPDKLFLITGRVTYSAAVHFTTVFRKHTQATTIGEPTAGRPNHYGAIRRFKLPNHPQVTIGCSIDYYQDSEPFDFNTTHTPDIAASMTASDYRNNIDPALARVRDYGRIIARVRALDEELKIAHAAGGLAAVKQAYALKKQELLDTGYNPERFFFEMRDNWFFKSKKSAAEDLDYLVFALGECPESIDLCYLLAERSEAESRADEAQKYYQQCLLLNPACHYAEMKLGLLGLK
jgi:hypothetical protein